ncbi:MAG: Gfo/Idh/MocA family oxidoreductase [Armatimonadetes bacterium]|jgi:predicted dehydrogenase|nr:Gfo/Idh/MocA family oxidoreductase [Armatimonadota bacterium]
MSHEKVRLGIVGTGNIARSHLNGYKILKDAGYDSFEICALCDNSDERRTAYAEAVKDLFGLTPPQFSSVEDLVAAGVVDAVDNCTPHAFHHATTIPCLEAGLHVMVEKPGGITLKASELIQGAQRRTGKIVAVAEQVRRGIKARTMKWALTQAKMIGELRFFIVEGFSFEDYAQPGYSEVYLWQWRLLKLMSGGGMALDAGAHMADMIRYLFGDVRDVYCRTAGFQTPTINSPELGPMPMDVEDTWFATLGFESGLVGTWSWSFSARGERQSNQVFYGSEGSARDRGGWMHPFQAGGDITRLDGSVLPYEDIEREYRASLDSVTRERLYPYGIEDDIALECWDFIDAIQKQRPPEVDIAEAMRAKAICLAMYESAASGDAIRVRDVLDGKVSRYQDGINAYWGI